MTSAAHLRGLSVFVLAATISGSASAADPSECVMRAERGLELHDTGRFVESLEQLQQCVADICPKIVRDDCRRTMLAIRKNAPRLFVRLRDLSGNDIVDAVVTVDGRALSAEDRALGLIVDPGVHVVRVSAPSAAPVEKTALVAAADRERVVEMVMATPSSAAPPTLTTSRFDPVQRPNRTAAWVVGGLGVAFAAAGGVVGATALAEYRSVDDKCGGACTSADVRSLRTRVIATDVLLGTGLVALIAATVLWFTAPEARR